MRPIIICVLVAIAAFAVADDKDGQPVPQTTSRATVRTFHMRDLPKGEVNLMCFGDWGENGKEQRAVAKAMAGYAKSVPVQFNGLISTGDNIYVKLKSLDDWTWNVIFEDMYDAETLNFPFYVIAGNHDYEGDRWKLQLGYTVKNPDSRFKYPARWYRLDFPAEAPMVSFLMLDSNKPKFKKEDWAAQTEWLEKEMAALPAARWKVAVAHHPLWSNGDHGDLLPLQKEWGPIFKKYKLDIYLNGHDHDLQHLELPEWPMSFVVSGGGGKTPTAMRHDDRGPFSRSIDGFGHMRFTPELMHFQTVDSNGKFVHEFTRTKAGKVEILMTTGRDHPSTRPLKQVKPFEDND